METGTGHARPSGMPVKEARAPDSVAAEKADGSSAAATRLMAGRPIDKLPPPASVRYRNGIPAVRQKRISVKLCTAPDDKAEIRPEHLTDCQKYRTAIDDMARNIQ